MDGHNELMGGTMKRPYRRWTRRTIWHGAVLRVCLLAMLLAGCASRKALPAELVNEAQPVGIPNVRAWAGKPSPLLQQDMIDSIRQVHAHSPYARLDDTGWTSVLAISGGGANGAYGAGLLNGWTESGRRPVFRMVTGVSTGALIAPFAFLGPEYDAKLKAVYTDTTADDIFSVVTVDERGGHLEVVTEITVRIGGNILFDLRVYCDIVVEAVIHGGFLRGKIYVHPVFNLMSRVRLWPVPSIDINAVTNLTLLRVHLD